ncbi:MAG: beta-ketoacyl-[acyl-carrier-protein] synthase family protein [Opitutales bacterium]|nr:beta-ketoacyl-[acyl-carrier-protein] synthase family protein [Opitutales bacterium]
MRSDRIVITGIGLTSPIGNGLAEMRDNLLGMRSNIQQIDIRYMGKVPAGVCEFDEKQYMSRRHLRVCTRAGSISVYCAHEAIADAGLILDQLPKDRIGVYLGITEHGNVETENEVFAISQYDYDVRYWTHHHNPRTVANNPAGEVTINMGITGPHYTIGAACAAGNAGLIQGLQMLRLGEVDMALAGGVSESIRSFGIFAGFKSQGALADHVDPNKASRPFDKDRNGIVVSEGGCIFVLERLDSALARGARIYGEIAGYAMNSDAKDHVLPDANQQMLCMRKCLANAGMRAEDIDLVNTHATSTPAGDVQECQAVRSVFGSSDRTYINNTKSYIGHAMGAAGALELAGNLPSFEDGMIHPSINVDHLDPECELPRLIINRPEKANEGVRTIFNNSFGMLGINSALIVKKFDKP